MHSVHRHTCGHTCGREHTQHTCLRWVRTRDACLFRFELESVCVPLTLVLEAALQHLTHEGAALLGCPSLSPWCLVPQVAWPDPEALWSPYQSWTDSAQVVPRSSAPPNLVSDTAENLHIGFTLSKPYDG